MSLGYPQRLGILAFLALCGTLGLLGRLLHLQVIEHARWEDKATLQMSTASKVPGRRGAILDAHGAVLAEDVAAFDLEFVLLEWVGDLWECPQCGWKRYLLPQEADPRRCPACRAAKENAPRRVPDRRDYGPLAATLGLSREEIVARIARDQEDRDLAVTRKAAGLAEEQRVEEESDLRADHYARRMPMFRNVSWEAAREVALHPDRCAGFRIRVVQGRASPGGSDFAHILGLVMERRDEERRVVRYGAEGIEAAFESLLAGREGKVVTVRDPGRPLGIRVESETPAQHGENVRLTIDAADQRLACDVMTGVVGALVVVDAESGAVLALASAPSYDPADRGAVHAAWAGRKEPEDSPLFDRASREIFTPGSILKPFTALAALSGAHVDPGETISCDGYLYLGGRRVAGIFRCDGVHEQPDLRAALTRSCNVYFETVMHRMMAAGDFERFIDVGRRFGFGEPTGLETERSRRLGVFPPSPLQWRRDMRLPSAIGQGDVKLTATQVARAYAALATGRLPSLHLSAGAGAPAPRPLDLDPAHLALVREYLRGVAHEGGTASGYGLDRWGTVCKTGTAQIGPHGDLHNAWLAGFVPARGGRPTIAFAMVVLRTTDHGSSACGPRLRDFLLGFYRERDE